MADILQYVPQTIPDDAGRRLTISSVKLKSHTSPSSSSSSATSGESGVTIQMTGTLPSRPTSLRAHVYRLHNRPCVVPPPLTPADHFTWSRESLSIQRVIRDRSDASSSSGSDSEDMEDMSDVVEECHLRASGGPAWSLGGEAVKHFVVVEVNGTPVRSRVEELQVL